MARRGFDGAGGGLLVGRERFFNVFGDRWIGADYWERAGDPALTLDTLLARSEIVVIAQPLP